MKEIYIKKINLILLELNNNINHRNFLFQSYEIVLKKYINYCTKEIHSTNFVWSKIVLINSFNNQLKEFKNYYDNNCI